MYMDVENIEVFLQMLEAEEDKETTPIFIKEVKAISQADGKLYAELLIQSQYDTCMIVQHRISEGFETVPQYSNVFLSSLDPAKRSEFESIMKAGEQNQDQQLQNEKQKIIAILQSKGYKIFVPEIWEE